MYITGHAHLSNAPKQASSESLGPFPPYIEQHLGLIAAVQAGLSCHIDGLQTNSRALLSALEGCIKLTYSRRDVDVGQTHCDF